MYDPKYKMKFRPTSPARLRKYEDLPPRMVGDPPERSSWEQRCRAVYEYMIALKNGVVPLEQRRGLWLYRDGASQ